MAETNTRGAFWGFEVRSRQLAGTWVTSAYVPPPPEKNASWFMGGNQSPGPTSFVDRITYASDTNTATTRGELRVQSASNNATGTLDFSWVAIGSTTPADVTNIDRITYTNDSSISALRGNLNRLKRNLSSVTDSTTYGWFGGGRIPASPFYISEVSRLSFSDDTTTTVLRGSLTFITDRGAATSNDTYGWFGGGYSSPAPGARSFVNRIQYSTDTGTASVRGPLEIAIFNLAATGNQNFGWFAGGSPRPISNISRITYATDTATAIDRGLLSIASSSFASSGNQHFGWFAGGSPGYKSTVNRVTFSDDTTTASIRGPLSQARIAFTSSSGVQ